MRRRRPYSVSPIASYADPQCASSRRGRSRTGVAAVLMGLLLEQFRTREAADRSARLAEPASLKATLAGRSEEHTSELQSLMRISYAVFCLKKKTKNKSNSFTLDKKYILQFQQPSEHRQSN